MQYLLYTYGLKDINISSVISLKGFADVNVYVDLIPTLGV